MEQPPAARGTDAPSQFPRHGQRDLGPDDPSRRRAYDWPGLMSLGHSFQVGGDAQNRTGDGGFADSSRAGNLVQRGQSELEPGGVEAAPYNQVQGVWQQEWQQG